VVWGIAAVQGFHKGTGLQSGLSPWRGPVPAAAGGTMQKKRQR